MFALDVFSLLLVEPERILSDGKGTFWILYKVIQQGKIKDNEICEV